MKTKAFNLSLVILFFVLMGASCTEKTCIEDPSIIQIDTIYITDTTYIIDTIYIIDPTVTILGKWEETAYGNFPNDMYPVENPLGYTEYLTDSVVKSYTYSTGKISFGIYWIDSQLYIGSKSPEGEFSLAYDAEYEFSNNNNTLRLYISIHDPFKTIIYTRIE